MWPLLAAGLLKYGIDKNNEGKDRQLQATKEMSSNFTGEHGAPVSRANLMGDLMPAGIAGMQMDQNASALGAYKQGLATQGTVGDMNSAINTASAQNAYNQPQSGSIWANPNTRYSLGNNYNF